MNKYRKLAIIILTRKIEGQQKKENLIKFDLSCSESPWWNSYTIGKERLNANVDPCIN